MCVFAPQPSVPFHDHHQSYIPNSLKRTLRPSILNPVLIGPGSSVQEFVHIPIAAFRMVFALQTSSDLLSGRFPLEIGTMEKAVELRARSLARVPETPGIRAEVLVPFEGESGRPVGVAAVGPGRGAPARIHEVDGLGDVGGAEHLAQRDEDLLLCGFVGLVVDDVGLVGDDGDEEDAAAGEEVGEIEVLPDRVVAPGRRSVEEELGGIVPEGFVGWELEEDLGVDSHLEGLDGDLLPTWEFGRECDVSGLEDTD